jgi:mannose-1-phosphate guanylyltransferase
MYALILAGGAGTRLWPRSRQQTPKQLLDIVTNRTMLQQTFERLQPLVPDQSIYVITNSSCVSEVVRQLPAVPAGNIIGEPSGRNTAPAVGLGSLLMRRRDPAAVVVAVSADHVVQKVDEFVGVMREAEELAEKGYLVTIGIKPGKPETGYGYIELGEPIATMSGQPAYEVARFTEKPDSETAARFLAGGRHLWNAGMFVWRVDVILQAIARYLPRLYEALMGIDAALGTERGQPVLEQTWGAIAGISIDFGVFERADNVAVVPADLGWSDVGTWASLADIMPADGDNNVVVAGEHIGVDTSGSLLYCGSRLIATIGLRDIIIVDTDDVVLVCPKSRAQEVRDLVEKLRRHEKVEYL